MRCQHISVLKSVRSRTEPRPDLPRVFIFLPHESAMFSSSVSGRSTVVFRNRELMTTKPVHVISMEADVWEASPGMTGAHCSDSQTLERLADRPAVHATKKVRTSAPPKNLFILNMLCRNNVYNPCLVIGENRSIKSLADRARTSGEPMKLRMTYELLLNRVYSVGD